MAAEFTDANFTAEVLQSSKPVLVDFWATWCPPCRMLGPIVEKLSKDLADVAKIGKLDADANGQVVAAYNVTNLPTLILFKGGKAVDQLVGLQPEPVLRNFILKHAK